MINNKDSEIGYLDTNEYFIYSTSVNMPLVICQQQFRELSFLIMSKDATKLIDLNKTFQ